MNHSDFAPCVEVTRANIVENRHLGAAMVVNSDGETLFQLGNPDLMVYPRSSAKFIQAIGLIESGAADAYQLSNKHLSLACASHLGEKIHTDLVAEWLTKINLSESDLACGADYPLGEMEKIRILKEGKDKSKIMHNCSGKHTAFLTICQHKNYPIDNYHELSHPAQQQFNSDLQQLAKVNRDDIQWGIDGCGFATPALKIKDMAVAMASYADYQSLDKSKASAIEKLHTALKQHPEYMCGVNHVSTKLAHKTNGRIISKIGADAYFVAFIPEIKAGLALKIADGNTTVSELFLLAIIDALKIKDMPKNLTSLVDGSIINSQGIEVGKMRAVDFA